MNDGWFHLPDWRFQIFLSPISSTGYLPNLLEDAVHEIIYRHFRLGRESRSGSEIPALDSIDDKALWKPTKYPRQFDSRDKAESMARPAEGSSGQWSPARIPAVERAGLRAGQDRVKEDDDVGPFPAVHQVRSLAAVLQHPERPRPLVLQSPGRDQPHPVVAPISVAYSDHQDSNSHVTSLREGKQILCCAQDDIWGSPVILRGAKSDFRTPVESNRTPETGESALGCRARSQFVDGVQRRVVHLAVELEAQFLAHARHFHVLGKDVTGDPAEFFLARDVQEASQ
jgi:hypothetical protein